MAETQAQEWEPPGGVLGELVAAAERRAAALAPPADGAAQVGGSALHRLGARGFVAALRGATVAVIAEIKRSSPSKGALNLALDAAARAADYAAGGAAAISVLTEPTRFGGSLADLTAVRRAVPVPVLRKDFIVRPAQLAEAADAGADGVLLIARALEPARLRDLAAIAATLGLDTLVEVRDERELELALGIPGCAVGVNTRNLETLEVDPAVGERLIARVPADRVAVYESGVSSAADVTRAANSGADAVLVGSALSPAADGVAAVRALCGVARRTRG